MCPVYARALCSLIKYCLIEQPHTYAGTAEEIKSELARLQSILANVTSGDAAAAAVKPLASDKGGRLLTLLQGVRQQRKEALNKEIDRLQQRLAAVAEAAEKGGKAAADSAADVTPEERMLEWLQENGGQVSMGAEMRGK